MLDGNSALISLSNETDEKGDGSELTTAVLDMPNIQFYISSAENTIFTFIRLPMENGNAKCRVIVRTLSGRLSIDVLDSDLLRDPCLHVMDGSDNPDLHVHPNSSAVGTFSPDSSGGARPGNKILEEIGNSLPECFLSDGGQIDEPDDCPFIPEADYELIREAVDSYGRLERDWAASDPRRHRASRVSTTQLDRTSLWNFDTCRSFLNFMGFFRFQKSSSLYLLKKNEKLIRELKYLDSQKCREVFKIAVIYVGDGQEDRQSILSNMEGSECFGKFISCLGWKVELRSHCGYMGGLSQHYENTGPPAAVTYYSTSTSEVVFHVSTELTGFISDFNQRLRHIGNDEVHIVWSEHWRDYRRRIIPTDFADVIIVIYPLRSGMFRIQLDLKPIYKSIQCWPLFDGAVVDQYSLPGLVRTGAINISRTMHQSSQFYVPFFMERDGYFASIYRNYVDDVSFGNFCCRSFEPSYTT